MSELTEPQLRALELLRDCDPRYEGCGVVTSGESAMYDSQAWIHFQTAHALHRRGLVEGFHLDGMIHCAGEGDEVRLTDRGREVLANA